jgi:hypothetical protein
MKASFYDMPHANHIQTALSGKTKFYVRNKTGHPEFLLERIVLRRVVEPDECERLKAERAGQENSERSVIAEGIPHSARALSRFHARSRPVLEKFVGDCYRAIAVNIDIPNDWWVSF